jgi:hypothetical protein
VATRTWAGKSRVHIPAGQDILIFAIMSRSALAPPQPQFDEYWGSLPRIKWLGYEADHLPPSSKEVKNEWS